jgi:hypothetical protein
LHRGVSKAFGNARTGGLVGPLCAPGQPVLLAGAGGRAPGARRGWWLAASSGAAGPPSWAPRSGRVWPARPGGPASHGHAHGRPGARRRPSGRRACPRSTATRPPRPSPVETGPGRAARPPEWLAACEAPGARRAGRGGRGPASGKAPPFCQLHVRPSFSPLDINIAFLGRTGRQQSTDRI